MTFDESPNYSGAATTGLRFAGSFEKIVHSKSILTELQGSEIIVDGKFWAASDYMIQWGYEALKRSLTGFASAYMDQGPHPHSFSETRQFKAGQFSLNGESMRSVTVNGACDLMIERGMIVSCIEVANRGRAFQWRCRFPDQEFCVDIGRAHCPSEIDDSQVDQSGYMRLLALPVYEIPTQSD